MLDYISLINAATTLEQLTYIRFNPTNGWETLYFAGQISYDDMIRYWNAENKRWDEIIGQPPPPEGNVAWLWMAGGLALLWALLKGKKKK